MAQVLVSYSRADEERARQIVEALGRSGFRVSQPRDFPLGVSMADAVAQQIERADCVVVLWSRAAARSEWAQREVHLAIEAWSAGKLLLVSLDDAPLPVGLRDLEAIPVGGAQNTYDVVARVAQMVHRDQEPRAMATHAPIAQARRPASGARRGPMALGAIVSLLLFAGIGAYWFSMGSAPPPAEPVGGHAEQPGKGAEAPEPSAPAPQPPPPPNEGAEQPAGDGGLLLPESPQEEPGTLPSMEINPDLERPADPLLVALATGLFGILVGAGLAFVLWRLSRRRAERRETASVAPASTQAAAALPEGMPVFVSYSRADLRDVDRLVKQIEQAGYGVWIDRQAHGSQRYAAPIVRAIKSSQLVALMCSQNAFASDHVIREIYIAGDCKKPFLVFQLDSSEFPDEVLYFVTGFPRLSVTALDPQGLRTELSRLLVN